MDKVTHFDLAVIGAGSGNTIVDDRFAHWQVAILEEGLFGGTCMNVGCIPTKMFVHPADLAAEAPHARELGVEMRVDGVRWAQVRDRIFGRIDPLATAGKRYREDLPNVTVYDGHCRFVGPRRIDTGTGEEITADRVVVAAGSRVVVPDIEGLSDVDFHTSDTIMRLEELPGRLAIVGGGFVAAEFAHVFSAYGVSVVQLERGPVLLRREDRDVSARFSELARRQWDVRLETQVVRARQDGATISLELSDSTFLEVDALLVATGRQPNSDELDVAAAGIDTDDEGVVTVDRQQRTSADGVWALGDIANHHQLKHVANYEARIIQHNLLHPDEPMARDDRPLASAVFTSPQVATVGVTEQEAERRGLSYVTATQAYADVAFGWAMGDHDHFVKLIADPDTGLLLGAHLIGPQASSLAQVLIQAMSLGQTVPEIARGQYWVHPALPEVIENALLKLALND